MTGISIPAPEAQRLSRWARLCLPLEGCALLAGVPAPTGRRVDTVLISPNRATDPCRNFEIDPGLHLCWLRLLRNSGRGIVAVWHSHPSGPAWPSDRDCRDAEHHDLVWLIDGTTAAGTRETRAFLVSGRCPEEIPLATGPDPGTSPSGWPGPGTSLSGWPGPATAAPTDGTGRTRSRSQ